MSTSDDPAAEPLVLDVATPSSEVGAITSVVKSREQVSIWTMRLWALVALASFTGLVVIALVVGVYIRRLTTAEAKDLALIVLTPLFTLLGTAVAFVFDSKHG